METWVSDPCTPSLIFGPDRHSAENTGQLPVPVLTENVINANDCNLRDRNLRLLSPGTVDSGFRNIHRGTRISFD